MPVSSITAKQPAVPVASPSEHPVPDGKHREGNPAVVGLAGFSLSTMLLQFHNVGWVGLGPVIWLGLIFGGGAQLIAGLQEKKAGNNFGYGAFTAYGCFWIALALMLIGNAAGLFKVTDTDVGWYLVVWTLYTAVMTVGALRISAVLGLVFVTLLVGFILLDLGHFVSSAFLPVAGYELMVCAGLALYGMAHIVYADVFGRDVLPMGRPLIR